MDEDRAEAERILNAVVVSERLSRGQRSTRPLLANGSDIIRALAWNLERGIKFDGIIDALKNDTELKDRDVLLLSELDHGMARSGNRFVAKEIAES